jgi:hypothetical protein
MKVCFITIGCIVGLLTASCSKKAESDREEKRDRVADKSDSDRNSRESEEEGAGEGEEEDRPESQDIGEDCVALLRATTVASRNPANGGDCPTCPAGGAAPEVLKFTAVKIDRTSPSGATCEVFAKISGTFNPSLGGEIVGGLTGWISPEQRAQYARGETPTGEQVYPVHITYRRTLTGWQLVEFTKPPP